MLDVIICLLLFIIGINLKHWISNFDTYDKRILNWLFLWHLFIGICYVLYLISTGGGDAYSYWNIPKTENWNDILTSFKADSATSSVFLINYFPSKVLNLSFFTGSMMYMVLGYAGFVFLYKIIKENISNYRVLNRIKILFIPIFPYFLFLPNLNFWTSGIGKDTIVFFSIPIFIYALKNVKKRFAYIILSVILSVFIRPHILLFLFTAYGLAIVFEVKIKIYKKIFLAIIFIGFFIILLPHVMDYAKIDNLNSTTIESYANKKAGALASKAGTESAIDISNYPYPAKVFTFLFRPLFVDMPTFLGLAVSIENLIFLIFFFKVLSKRAISNFLKNNIILKTLLFFFIIGSLTFPLILGNLGIIIREKTPFILVFIIFGYSAIINYYTIKASKQKMYFEMV